MLFMSEEIVAFVSVVFAYAKTGGVDVVVWTTEFDVAPQT